MDKALFINPNQADEKMVFLRVMNYRDSNALYVVLVGADMKDAGVPIRTITTKPDQDIPIYHGAVKSEDKELAIMLIKEGLATPTDELAYSGFQTLHVLSFDRDALMKHDPNGTQDYEERINDRSENGGL